jgi:hypothetical protein
MTSHPPQSAIDVLYTEFKREIGLSATIGYPADRQRGLQTIEKHLNILLQIVRYEAEKING